MSVVLGATSFLLRRTDLTDAAQADVKAIQRAAERTAAVTAQLLAFSRRQMWRPRVLDADAVIREIAPVLRRTIGDHSALTLSLGSSGIRIRLDPGQLEQTLLNLAMNARDAMPRGGEVTLTTRLVHLGTETEGAPPGVATRPGPYLRLDFRDTGEGMDSETFGHLFEPFFTTKPVGKGTGLGLASVYGIVKQGHGYVWAASEPGQGSTFTIHFPVVTDAPFESGSPPLAGGANPGEVVLVAEDEPGVLTMTARALREAGYTVVEAQNGREALDIVERHTGRMDLVLADVAMPDMDGLELADALRQRYPDVPVLLMSGATGEGADTDPESAGALFLQKPFSPDGLAAKVRALIDRAREHRAE
jgi:CheY-like chemotaxis protein